MLSSICDWKPGKGTFSVPENVFPSPENAGEARESCMSLTYAHPRFLRRFPVPPSRFPVWICSPQVNISRVPHLTFFLSLTTYSCMRNPIGFEISWAVWHICAPVSLVDYTHHNPIYTTLAVRPSASR